MGRVKILLVDDELDFLEAMGTRLESWGYNPLKASNGKDALLTLEKETPDIIILDYMMPDMSGVSVLKEIRKKGLSVPVIMFTAYPDMKVMDDSERLGISAFVHKLSTHVDTLTALKSAINIAKKNL